MHTKYSLHRLKVIRGLAAAVKTTTACERCGGAQYVLGTTSTPGELVEVKMGNWSRSMVRMGRVRCDNCGHESVVGE